jgi:hypothetical protein
VLDDEEVPSGQVNPRAVESDKCSGGSTHQEHPRINSMPEQRLVQQSLTYHRDIHVRLQGWQEGHATGTEWDPILVVTKVMAELAEDEGNHVPKLSAYQVRNGVIDFILRRFSLNEIAQGQAGEALQQVVKQVSQPYFDRMKSVFPKEVEQNIVTKLIMRCCQTIPDTPYMRVLSTLISRYSCLHKNGCKMNGTTLSDGGGGYMKCCIFKRKSWTYGQ